MPQPSLYIHIPYCHHKCTYCDFYSGPLRSFNPQTYAQALRQELEARTTLRSFPTIYIGGGTPSAVPPEVYTPFLKMLAPGGEATVELNPEDVTPTLAATLHNAGANRISMGIQSLNNAELQLIGRHHSASQALQAYHTLQQAGFNNISLDIIYGLPSQTLQSWQQTLTQILNLHPTHLSAYCLSIEPRTRLHSQLQAGSIPQPNDNLIPQMYDLLCQLTAQAGYEHYEIANFALPGHHSRHNSAYWDCTTPYIGLGPGAHSFDGTTRAYNPANLPAYLAAPTSTLTTEPETPTEHHNDILLTALRTAAGINPALLTHTEIAKAGTNLTKTPQGHLRIPEKLWLNSNSIIIDLMRD